MFKRVLVICMLFGCGGSSGVGLGIPTDPDSLGSQVTPEQDSYSVGDVATFHGGPVNRPTRSDTLVYYWVLVQAPPGNTTDIEPVPDTPSVAHLELLLSGKYTVQLIIDSQNYGQSNPSTASITVD